ncbi:MAG: biopolymer transporter ExbD [Planctomycetes bacterium]|nr:biopolymer transporter ExbD [Planctomycetota bacterium]
MKRVVVGTEVVDEFNMTPMIDVTFQLLVFFMLTLNMTQAQIEKLDLPDAPGIEKINWTDSTIVLVNISDIGEVKIGGKTIYNPGRDKDNIEGLNAFFRNVLRHNPDPTDNKYSKSPVIIRADKNTDWEHIQRVEQVAAKEGGVLIIMYGAEKEVNK